jgi:hypothetical protein
MTDFWDIEPRSLVEADRGFIILVMESVRTSETSDYFNETTRRSITESFHLRNNIWFDVCHTNTV